MINLDFADVKTVMGDRGVAHMGVGQRHRAKTESLTASESLQSKSPLLETDCCRCARLCFSTSQADTTSECSKSTKPQTRSQRPRIKDAIVIFGTSVKEDMQDEIVITDNCNRF